MEKILIYPKEYAGECSEILLHKEPRFLHNILWLTFSIVVTVSVFVALGKMEEVVKANGIVRPEVNVSSVKNITSGEIETVYYKPGQFVDAGEKLLAIKADSIVAEKNVLMAQLTEVEDKILGVSSMIQGYENKKTEINCSVKSSNARYSAFIAEKKVLEAKTRRMKFLYDEELCMPASSTTKSAINECKFNYDMCRLEEEEYSSSFISSLRQELEQLTLNKKEIVQREAQTEISLKNLLLISPVAGYVQEVSSLNPGDYIFSDQQVLNIIPPSDSSCRVELHIPADRMGKLEIGQNVKLRFPAFPYSEYRGIEGQITVIQPDSQCSANGELYFVAYADVSSLVLKNRKNVEYLIKPGFEVDARIVLDNQTLLYFLMKKLDFTV